MINNIILRHDREDSWLQFSAPEEVLVARRHEEVMTVLQKVDDKVSEGFYAAGFCSYEAATGFDEALTTNAPGEFPLVCFGIYKNVEKISKLEASAHHVSPKNWTSSENFKHYDTAIKKIKQLIAAGDTYQVNFTFRRQADFSGDPWQFFLGFASDARFGAYIEMEDYAICCASPELFFSMHEGKINLRPMKGTAKRGLTFEDDEAQREKLFKSQKDRAENIMIVDMIRNDVSKIATTGSIQVTDAFNLEKYPTVWQMTSTVSADSTKSVSDVMQAMFPSASITGAPKVNTMRIITSLEPNPRNIYTGSIGFISPDKEAQFNVAIRTALVNIKNNSVEYGVGGGIVWDSVSETEYEECEIKSRVVQTPNASIPFSLIETLLWTPENSYFLLDSHLKRMRDSAEYFDISFNCKDVEVLLHRKAAQFNKVAHKIRLLLSQDSGITFEATQLPSGRSETPKKEASKNVALALHPVRLNDVFLYHKTTHREVYENAREDFPDADDVLLWNEQGEMTESTIANIVVKRGSKYLTPKLACGLLPGTFRQFLLDTRKIEEAVIKKCELQQFEEIFLVNSVRQWQSVSLANPETACATEATFRNNKLHL